MAQFLYSNFLFVAKTWNFTKRYCSKYLNLQVKWCPDNCTREKVASRTISSEENCPRPPVTIAPHHKISLEKNCPTQANSSQRVLPVNWGKLCIMYEYFNMWVLLLRSKKWFTSIYFYRFQLNLTEHTYKRAPFTKCLLIFLRQNAKTNRYNFLEKLIRRKYKKTSCK